MPTTVRTARVTQIAVKAAQAYMKAFAETSPTGRGPGQMSIHALALRWWIAHPREVRKAWDGLFSAADARPRDALINFPSSPLGQLAYAEYLRDVATLKRMRFGAALDEALRCLPMPACADVLRPYLLVKEAALPDDAHVRVNARTVGRIQALAQAWGLTATETVGVLLNTHPSLYDSRIVPVRLHEGIRAAAAAPPAPEDATLTLPGLGAAGASVSP